MNVSMLNIVDSVLVAKSYIMSTTSTFPAIVRRPRRAHHPTRHKLLKRCRETQREIYDQLFVELWRLLPWLLYYSNYSDHMQQRLRVPIIVVIMKYAYASYEAIQMRMMIALFVILMEKRFIPSTCVHNLDKSEWITMNQWHQI